MAGGWARSATPAGLVVPAPAQASERAAPRSTGIDVEETFFILVGEPYTEDKAAVVAKAGSRAACHYAMAEAGLIGLACQAADARRCASRNRQDRHDPAREVASDDGKRSAGVVPYHAAPGVTEGDAERRERRLRCARSPGLRLRRPPEGIRYHLHTIRSYEKLTSEGMSFLGSDLLSLVEDVLPRRFGGCPTDYQFVEPERDGLPRVSLVVGPGVGELDEDGSFAPRSSTSAAVGEDRDDGRHLGPGAHTRVERGDPHVTPGGKILPLQPRRVARARPLQFDAVALPLIERMLRKVACRSLPTSSSAGRWETIDAHATVLQSATYPTLCTGVDVREHGLYSAFPWSAPDQRARFSHTFPKPRTIWERLTERGRRSLIVDPISAWAPRAMAGVYLSGWHFEDRMV